MSAVWRRWRGPAARVGRVVVGASAAIFGIVAYIWMTTPDVRPLRRAHPESTAFMQMRAAEARETGQTPRVRHRWVPLGRIAPILQRAVVVTEDAAFWGHTGIDLHEIRISLSEGIADGNIRGASTITQQLAKNLYLSPSRNPTRKVAELFIARRLEAVLSKRRILELYLNLVEWGAGIWGAEAASQAYFGVPAAALSAEQAALLAGSLINPRVYSPARPNQRLLRRQQIILGRLN
jgi:monofunctional biosynthetic peptidoglycan transglycosylase